MLTGLMNATGGTAYVENLELGRDMGEIYKLMGVCPQHDLLWPTLTAKEHLSFYGRLKKLSGAELETAVRDGLDGVNLLTVQHKKVGEFSGGMKRRLSVAIALMGNPRVVYLDEPSTGLDPASRKALWKVVKQAKKVRDESVDAALYPIPSALSLFSPYPLCTYPILAPFH